MLELRNVTKIFNAQTVNETRGISDLSLKVNDGDFITIIGPNGSGKSTLFNLIAGSLISDSGDIFLDGVNITLQKPSVRSRSIGRLFQDPLAGNAPEMTVAENLALAAKSGGWLKTISRTDRQFFREKLSILNMGLEDCLDQPVGLLSGGQRQALSLMMATINPPKLLLLDEHTAALDPSSGEKVLQITEKIVSENHLSCLMITHDMADALRMGNRTIMLEKGRIIMDLSGPQRREATVQSLVEMFRKNSGRMLADDELMLNV